MALHAHFPASPFVDLAPEHRGFPAAEELRGSAYEKLLPPLIARIREGVAEWRLCGCPEASDTSRALLNWGFHTQHRVESSDGSRSAFRCDFAQRAAVETGIRLHDVRAARDKFDLIRFDASGAVSTSKTTDSRTDLGEIVREVDELAVFDDEAHHIHDARLAWFECIQDIHHRMLQKDMTLSLPLDVAATPRHNNGAIFVQTVSDDRLVGSFREFQEVPA